MLKRTPFLASVAAVTLLALPLSAETGIDQVVATVNGTDITMGHMIVVRSGLPDQYRNLPDDVLFKGILDQVIQQTILAAQAGGDTPDRVRLALENERRALMAAEHMDVVLADAVTEDAVAAAYEKTYAGAVPEREFDASHILVETEDEAKALVTDLDGGADFAELAKEKSTGPSGPRGGALGWFGTGQMVPEFENAVKDMEVGAVSTPIKTQFGWHVIKLNDTRSKDAPKIDDVRADLEQQVRMETVDAYIAKLTEGATISKTPATDIDTSKLSDLSLLEK
ncbi:MAG: peptidylprolyl isomerase [Planktotalea sp.]|jgi:peptidyl-prolyl cis-trans isomerase C|uniref:peptidylprolyl isomerase n=1 Tax=Planktotalea sp. TaxID=2029877 RepID=UPI000EE11E2C|nr:peptidylprolyl isomerase [Planktotalea sp.]MBT5822346.1 peptidylprolyl isomerase [Paracoccaceae bacterium]MDG1075980.1 peptidylprolyl isomerase [Planktotalea sp.]MDG1083300.1 peptidylprolyl isomerase [Planktotalea sp.]HCW85231.1 peptidylprolyl isomerase [Paracoccaceae bacterium]